MFGRHAEKDPGGALGSAAPLFPVLKGANADAGQGSELLLRQALLRPQFRYVGVGNPELPGRLGFSPDDGSSFPDAL